MSQFYGNIFRFFISGVFSVSLGQKAIQLWAQQQRIPEATPDVSQLIIQTEEFTSQQLREKEKIKESCCQSHSHTHSHSHDESDLEAGDKLKDISGLQALSHTMER